MHQSHLATLRANQRVKHLEKSLLCIFQLFFSHISFIIMIHLVNSIYLQCFDCTITFDHVWWPWCYWWPVVERAHLNGNSTIFFFFFRFFLQLQTKWTVDHFRKKSMKLTFRTLPLPIEWAMKIAFSVKLSQLKKSNSRHNIRRLIPQPLISNGNFSMYPNLHYLITWIK